MLEVGARSPWCVRALSRWAKRIGTEASKADEEGRPMPWGYTAANALVFSNVKRALGLSQCRILVSAAAPLQPATLAYFASLNMPVCEVYGMSECAGESVPLPACMLSLLFMCWRCCVCTSSATLETSSSRLPSSSAVSLGAFFLDITDCRPGYSVPARRPASWYMWPHATGDGDSDPANQGRPRVPRFKFQWLQLQRRLELCLWRRLQLWLWRRL